MSKEYAQLAEAEIKTVEIWALWLSVPFDEAAKRYIEIRGSYMKALEDAEIRHQRAIEDAHREYEKDVQGLTREWQRTHEDARNGALKRLNEKRIEARGR